tara:strand:+ start:584 stop:1627 length:1044 start_codon:yes stop_codon:yes gene_type:complete
MKYFITLGLIINLIACNKPTEDKFNVDVKVKGDYSGYLFLITNKKLDSSLVINGKSQFSGRVDSPLKAGIITDTISGYNKEFYLENNDLELEINVTKNDFGNGPVDWIIVENIIGSKTEKIREDFEEFKSLNAAKENWNKKLYNELHKLITENQNNRLPGDLLAEVSSTNSLKKIQLQNLYLKLDKKVQDPFTIKKLEQNIYPDKILTVGDQLFDIKGENYLSKEVSTQDFRGDILLIDFWASWCKPCIDKFPELKIIEKRFKEDNLTVIGISLEEERNKWKIAIDKHNLTWTNIFINQNMTGEISKIYGINSIPFNIVINREGQIIAKNVSENDISQIIDESKEAT